MLHIRFGKFSYRIPLNVNYAQEFSLLHVVQTGSGAHPASYPWG
jgi:hypothetical protein